MNHHEELEWKEEASLQWDKKGEMMNMCEEKGDTETWGFKKLFASSITDGCKWHKFARIKFSFTITRWDSCVCILTPLRQGNEAGRTEWWVRPCSELTSCITKYTSDHCMCREGEVLCLPLNSASGRSESLDLDWEISVLSSPIHFSYYQVQKA